jgi:hypothetical protein
VFSRFLLPQRGQKCNASSFAEDSFDGVADPVITYNQPLPMSGAAIASERPAVRPESADSLQRRSFSGRGQPVYTSAFTGTDRGLRSVFNPRSSIPKCEALGASISVEPHTSMVPRPRQPPKSESSAFKNRRPFRRYRGLQKPRLRYSPGLAPTTRLNALLNAASDS